LHSETALRTIISNTGCVSRGDPRMIFKISPVAAWNFNASSR
jgi:hypothetical protein